MNAELRRISAIIHKSESNARFVLIKVNILITKHQKQKKYNNIRRRPVVASIKMNVCTRKSNDSVIELFVDENDNQSFVL
jgi:hypothetical protein